MKSEKLKASGRIFKIRTEILLLLFFIVIPLCGRAMVRTWSVSAFKWKNNTETGNSTQLHSIQDEQHVQNFIQTYNFILWTFFRDPFSTFPLLIHGNGFTNGMSRCYKKRINERVCWKCFSWCSTTTTTASQQFIINFETWGILHAKLYEKNVFIIEQSFSIFIHLASISSQWNLIQPAMLLIIDVA